MFKNKSEQEPASEKLLAMWPSKSNSKTKSQGSSDITLAMTYVLLLIVIPLVAIAYIFYSQRNERIDCSKLSSDSINYLQQGGEEIPFNCGLDR